MVVSYGSAYSRSSGAIGGSGTTTPVSCTVGGGQCSASFTAPAGAPLYYESIVRDGSGNPLVTQPVQVILPM